MNQTMAECRVRMSHNGTCWTIHGVPKKSCHDGHDSTHIYLTRAVSNKALPHQVLTGNTYLLFYEGVCIFHTDITVTREKRTKFDDRLVGCRFLGYLDHSKAYRFKKYNITSSLSGKSLYIVLGIFL